MMVPADGTLFSPALDLAVSYPQLAVFLCMALTLLVGVWFIQKNVSRNLPLSPMTRSERELGATVRVVPASIYRNYRNPMRVFRRFLGWPSGRQWVKRRKEYNRLMPDGARQFAQMAVNMRRNLGIN